MCICIEDTHALERDLYDKDWLYGRFAHIRTLIRKRYLQHGEFQIGNTLLSPQLHGDLGKFHATRKKGKGSHRANHTKKIRLINGWNFFWKENAHRGF